MQPLPVTSLDDPRVADYRNVKDAELRRERGLFLVEGRFGVRRLVAESPFRTRSLFLTRAALAGLSDALAKLPQDVPVYLAEQRVLDGVVGYPLHRGCLAAAERGPERSVDSLLDALSPGARVVALEDVTNADNVGSVFRNARAFGAGAVMLTPRCADPLSRKAVRVSMGGALFVPFAHCPGGAALCGALRAAGFVVLALAPGRRAESIEAAAARWAATPRLALLFGTEGEGLSPAALGSADGHVAISMAEGVDSLNVATASGIALHRFGRPLETQGR